MLVSKDYLKIRHELYPGDVIAFGGSSLFSRWTKFTTGSVVSHVAIVFDVQNSEHGPTNCKNKVVEAATLDNRSGVMVNSLIDRINAYKGDIWWLPLKPQARASVAQNMDAFINFLTEKQGESYDVLQLFGAAVDIPWRIPLLSKLTHNKQNFDAWFCSELVSQSLKIAGVINQLNASEVTPIDICRFNLFDSHYVQLKGRRKTIAGFNSLDPQFWGYDK